MVRFLFLQSEGLTNHLAVGNDAPNRLEGLIFGERHGEHLAELYGLVKVSGEDWGWQLSHHPKDMDGGGLRYQPGCGCGETYPLESLDEACLVIGCAANAPCGMR